MSCAKCRASMDITAVLLYVLVPLLVVVSACSSPEEIVPLGKVKRAETLPVPLKSVVDICQVPGCNCTEISTWKYVNCTFNSSQEIELEPGSVPGNIIEMSIIGGEVLVFKSATIQMAQGLSLLRVDGTKNLIIHKQAFSIDSPTFFLQVQDCQKFVLESNGIKTSKTSITLEVKHCNQVAIKTSAFSKLSSGTFEHISSLILEETTFSFEINHNDHHHGPVTNLSFLHVKIVEIPRRAFVASLSEIKIHKCEIRNIQSEAFGMNLIASISIRDTTINKMQARAFSDKTLIIKFVLNNSKIAVWESNAIKGAVTNLTVINNTITEIGSEAVVSTTATAIIKYNKIKTIASEAIILKDFNQLLFTNNIITSLNKSFINFTFTNPNVLKEFHFVENEIYHTNPGALAFVPLLLQIEPSSVFKDNLFNQTCHCTISDWLGALFDTQNVFFALNTSFCTVDPIISNCFKINERLINMENFTELVCGDGDKIICEEYNGETKILDTTATMLFDEEDSGPSTQLVWGIFVIILVLIAVSGTIVILLIKGGIWMKKKGYCVHFRDRLNHAEQSFDDERDMVEQEPCTTEEYDEGDDLERLKELLDRLKKDMESPDDDIRLQAETHIQKLYEQFSATNNNRQEEETHLYEELGNMQNGKPKTLTNLHIETQSKPVVVDYSEPTDAAVHFYSELKQNKSDEDDISHKSSLKSNASGKMAFRPLPEKPRDIENPGPSRNY
ncbi:uncharacterized protein [Onthophagus taurus]|uniref:uncharacterized protein n=1 Tax=Onthophagus taurus TaxID=166361 RepID=UPI0039BE142C